MTAGDLITDVWQVEWRATLFGAPATSLGVTGLTGWLDLPPTRSTPVDRPSRHGQFPSQLRASGRTIEVELTLLQDDTVGAINAVIDATTIGEDDQEEPLVLWAGTTNPQVVFARIGKRSVTTDHAWSVGDGVATVQWACSDPRRYSVTQHQATMGLPTAGSGGLLFPLVFPLTFGTGPVGGHLALANAGNVATWPTFTVTGPVTGPVITCVDTGQQIVFAPTYLLPAGQSVAIDTDLRTVVAAGGSVRNQVTTAQWFPLAADATTTVALSSVGGYDPSAQLTVAWRDAWL